MPTTKTTITNDQADGWVLAHQHSTSASVDVQATKGMPLEVFVNTSGTTKPADTDVGIKLEPGGFPLSVTLASTEHLWVRVFAGYNDNDQNILIKNH